MVTHLSIGQGHHPYLNFWVMIICTSYGNSKNGWPVNFVGFFFAIPDCLKFYWG